MGAREKLEADLRELMDENGVPKQQYVYKSVDKLLLLLTGNVIDEWVESEKERGRKAMDDACKSAASSAPAIIDNASTTAKIAREKIVELKKEQDELKKEQLEILKEIKTLKELKASKAKSKRYADAIALYGELVNEGINRGVTPDVAGTNASYVAWAAIKNEIATENRGESEDTQGTADDADDIDRINSLINKLESQLKGPRFYAR